MTIEYNLFFIKIMVFTAQKHPIYLTNGENHGIIHSAMQDGLAGRKRRAMIPKLPPRGAANGGLKDE